MFSEVEWMTFKSLNIVLVLTVYRFLCVCCCFRIDELSPGSQQPLIQSACLHVHCFLALMYYREQAVVCAVTAWIKLCHSFFTAAAVLFCRRSEMLRGEDISLTCQAWSLYLNVDWTRQRWRSLDLSQHTGTIRAEQLKAVRGSEQVRGVSPLFI